MKLLIIFALSSIAICNARDCVKENAEKCFDQHISVVVSDLTDEEWCDKLNLEYRCLTTAVTECSEEPNDEVKKAINDLEKSLEERCSRSENKEENEVYDEETLKCLEDNYDFIAACMHEIATKIFAEIVENNAHPSSHDLECRMLHETSNCMVEKVTEKCGAKSAAAVKKVLDDTAEISEACKLVRATDNQYILYQAPTIQKIKGENNEENNVYDDETLKCLKDNHDFIAACTYEIETKILTEIVKSNAHPSSDDIECRTFHETSNCIVERIAEKCGSKYAAAVKKVLDDAAEITEACQSAKASDNQYIIYKNPTIQKSKDMKKNSDYDEETRKCLEDNNDFIAGCVYEITVNIFAEAVERNVHPNSNDLKCRAYRDTSNCMVKNTAEKCGVKAAATAKKDLDDAPADVVEACKSAEDDFSIVYRSSRIRKPYD